MKYYLCQEDGEQFVIPAKDHDAAREECVMWNAEVIRELTPDELKNSDPHNGKFAIAETTYGR